MNFLKYILMSVGVTVLVFSSSLFVYAQGTPGNAPASTPGNAPASAPANAPVSTPGNAPASAPGNAPSASQLMNPLGSTTLEGFFLKIIDILLIFALPLIVFFIMFSGFKYVMARGNPGKIEEATSSLTWAVVGGLLIIGAKVILEIIKSTVQSLQ